ncbi:hypothetical protein [Psychromonas algicola]|uniref:hypothetical protein n=1 Tax=Psychromonas algicola TaxID=2555642 RepID=UPI0010686577|nr:hypothetical protein [Psychromonas sp. RZ5]TEW52892.1 hypothetical protein E2R67_00365 [Psychromonas sp. RZ5]
MKFLILILSITLSNLVYADVFDKMNKIIAKRDERVSILKDKKQRDVTRMYYFVNHIDEVDTPEKIKLEAFLSGLKEGFSINFYMQKQAFGKTWFCSHKSPFYGKNSDDYVINLIKWVYKNQRQRFSEDAGIYSPTSNALAFGLQANLGCSLDPKVRLAGYNYSNLLELLY